MQHSTYSVKVTSKMFCEVTQPHFAIIWLQYFRRHVVFYYVCNFYAHFLAKKLAPQKVSYLLAQKQIEFFPPSSLTCTTTADAVMLLEAFSQIGNPKGSEKAMEESQSIEKWIHSPPIQFPLCDLTDHQGTKGTDGKKIVFVWLDFTFLTPLPQLPSSYQY